MKNIFKALQQDRKLFLLAIFSVTVLLMPLLVNLTSSEQRFNLFSRAEKIPQLRLWLEPATIITKPNQTVTLKLIADFDGENQLLPNFKALAIPDAGLFIMPGEFNFAKPFRGQIEVGTIEVVASNVGQFALNLSVSNTASSSPLDVKTSSATIISEK